MSQATDSSELGNPRDGRMSLRMAHFVFGSAMLVACGLMTALYSWPRHGTTGIAASLSALTVCWGGAALAMSASRLVRGPQNALAVTVLGILLRMGLPLVAVVVVTLQGGPLADSGFVVCVLAYYAIALVLETWLSLRLMSLGDRREAR